MTRSYIGSRCKFNNDDWNDGLKGKREIGLEEFAQENGASLPGLRQGRAT